jgi:hypothetical protein
MPFWKRETPGSPAAPVPPSPLPPPPPPAFPLAPPPTALTGSLPCVEHGCTRQDAVRCDYVDRRRRPCPTSWCPDHQVIVNGRALCRRHARTLTATSGNTEFNTDSPIPDLDNRSPSLADYVGDALEPRVVALLEGLCRPGSNDRVGAEPVRPVHPAGGGARYWGRTWKLYDHTGVQTSISVEVDEEHDPEVWVRVGGNVVAQGIPPWIDRRRNGLPELSDAEDAEARERFYAALWEAVTQRVTMDLESARSFDPGY